MSAAAVGLPGPLAGALALALAACTPPAAATCSACAVAEECGAEGRCHDGCCRRACAVRRDCAATETCHRGVCLPDPFEGLRAGGADADSPAGCDPPCTQRMPDSSTAFCTNGAAPIPCPTAENEPFWGQDGTHRSPLSDYELTAETALDRASGLRWQRPPAGQAPMSRDAWTAHCSGLQLGAPGTTWRLASLIELVTLVDFGRSAPPLVDPAIFAAVEAVDYHTSTPDAVLSFYDGRSKWIAANNDLQGLCVSGPALHSGAYASSGDWVLAPGTRLRWQLQHQAGRSWAEALAYCEGLELAPTDTWRLPTVKELQTLVLANAAGGPAIDTSVFSPQTPQYRFHTSTPYAGQADHVWVVSFQTKASYYSMTSQTADSFVRCVADQP